MPHVWPGKVLPLRAHLELCAQQFYASALQPSHLIITSLPSPTPQAMLHASFHRTLRVQLVRGDDSKAPPVIFGGVLEEGTYPLPRRLLWGRMIREIVRSQSPNKVLLAAPPPVDPAEQLLPLSYRSALFHLLPPAPVLLHSIGWADNLACPNFQTVNHSMANLFSCPAHTSN